MSRLAGLLLCVLGACTDPTPPDRSVEQRGKNGVSTMSFTVHDASRGRDLPVRAWFPAPAVPSELPIENFESPPRLTRYAELLAAAPACPTRTLESAPGGDPAPGRFPLVMLSHCHACTLLSNATTAIRLASHGLVAVAVEHAGDTLWEKLDGNEAGIDSAELEVRAADVSAVIDAIAAGGTPVSDSVDLTRVGVLGHSMGAVTAGRVAQLDPRIRAAAALCAPMENPLTPGVELAKLTMPLMFVVAVEDGSITELGNKFIRDNYKAANGPAYKLEIVDAGHWSVSDLDGLVTGFMPGCGDAIRTTDDQPFTFIDPPTGRAIAASYATAFFKTTLLDDAGARAYVEAASPTFGGAVRAEHHD